MSLTMEHQLRIEFERKMKITGVIVNEKINIDRKWMNLFRAELHHASKNGIPNDETGINLKLQLQGKFSFLKMVNEGKYHQYFEKYKHIFA